MIDRVIRPEARPDAGSARRTVGGLRPQAVLGVLGLDLASDRERAERSHDDEEKLLHECHQLVVRNRLGGPKRT